MNRWGKAFFGYLLIAFLVSCSVGPDYSPPTIESPERYSVESPGGERNSLNNWWVLLNDELLNSLVSELLSQNLDLKIAASRIREARTLVIGARSGFFPKIDLGGSYSRYERSDNSTFSSSQSADGASQNFGFGVQDLLRSGFDSSWELDIFGGVRRQTEGAIARFEAQEEEYRAVTISLVGELVLAYIDLRVSQERLALTKKNGALQEDILFISEAKFNAGLVSELDVLQARAQANQTLAEIPRRDKEVSVAIHQIALLLGKFPRDLESRLVTYSGSLPLAPSVPTGLPSELLTRRPDIRRAERLLAAYTADVGVATSDLFPKFSLTAMIGYESRSGDTFFDSGSRYWSFSPGLRLPVFYGGELLANLRASKERLDQALLEYERTILVSFQEVEDSLKGLETEKQRIEKLTIQVEASRRASLLSRDLYSQGVSDFERVLQADDTLFKAEDSKALSQGVLLSNFIALCKGLGGGWVIPEAS